MAAAYVRIYYEGELIRKFGGNVRQVRKLIEKYKNECQNKQELKDYIFEYVRNN
jgi:ATP-dependent protease HslVU (ClpYQ) peptidase subunit